MSWGLGTVIVGITSFAATNIDDLLISIIFFGQTNAYFRPRHILIGKYLGFIGLIIASLPGFFGGLIIPKIWIGLLGFLPIAIGINHLLNSDLDSTDIQTITGSNSKSQIFKVAAVTFANGGDNIGIYVPLFASSDVISLVVILSIFLIGIVLWYYLAYLLSRQPAIARFLTNYGHRVMPFVLIGLGIYILVESETYRLLTQVF